MNREQLDQRNTGTIRRHYRQLTDTGGRASRQLLDELAATADEYAQGIDSTTLGSSSVPPTMPPAGPPPRPRRTTTGGTAK